jgi:glucokinase-like ROK family protein
MRDIPTFPGSNITLVKFHNLRAVLLSFLHQEHISRVQLARQTNLSSTTITNLISELLEQGIVIEEGVETAPDERRVGRPPTALRLVPDARYAIGVHIGIGLVRIAIADLYARLIYNQFINFDIHTPALNVLDQIVHEVKAGIQYSGIAAERILGIGVGASGLVNFSEGINILAPNLEWVNIPIRDYFHEALGLPVVVDNNVRTMALGEAFFGAGRGANSLAFVYGRVGVGAGFVFNGRVFRGSAAGAGEIGHIKMISSPAETCRCGKQGCLETLVSETILVREAKKLAESYPQSVLAGFLRQNKHRSLPDIIFDAARQGDQRVQELIQTQACYLGIALANLVNMMNPELILLGGLFAQGQDLIVPIASETMRKQAFAGLGDSVTVRTTSFGWRAGVTGAAALALMTFFYQEP